MQRLFRTSTIGLLLAGSWLQAAPAAADSPLCPAQLPTAIASVTQQASFRRSRWGILIQTLSAQPQTLYAQDAESYFIPASNAKLLTTAAALEQLGDQFRVQTSVYPRTQPNSVTSLYIIGQGDPTLTTTQLNNLAQQIRDRSITQVANLIGIDAFAPDAVNPTWEWDDVQAGYGAAANSLILNQNWLGLTLIPQQLGQPLGLAWDDPQQMPLWQVVNRSVTVAADQPEFVQVGRDLSQPIVQVAGQLRVGSAAEPVAVAIPNPGQFFLDQFQQALVHQGVQVNRTVLQTGLPADQQAWGAPVAQVTSPPLSALLKEADQESNNLYAEIMLRWMGMKQGFPESSLNAGLATAKAALTRLGVDPQSYDLVDGSGLSRQNLVSPEAIVQTLQGMAQSPNRSTYRTSLAVAGVSGTLKHRFQGSPVEGKLQGKTGTLRGVVALSGYLNPPNYPPLVFSMLVNQTDLPATQVQQAIDTLINRLIQLRSCQA